MRPTPSSLLLALAVVLLIGGCTGPVSRTAAEASTVEQTLVEGASRRPVPTMVPGAARLEPSNGTYFGMNLDWASDSVAAVTDRLGVTPAVWVQFVAFPLDDGGEANLDAFIEQVAAVGGIALITLEPHGGLASVTPQAAEQLASVLDGNWQVLGVPTLVRFAHEMNGSWYPWGQQPAAYVAAFETLANAVHASAPASAMIWAPNEGSGYPFSGGQFEAEPAMDDHAALDTNGDGTLDGLDDPYAPYYPGDEAADWVGMSLYHWGNAYPWGENELPPSGKFGALLTGDPVVEHAEAGSVPDFYATYAEGHDKPVAIVETAALYDPAATEGPTEAALKSAWFGQVFSPGSRDAFPRIRMINWFEWRKEEPEVGRVIDWRLTADADLARTLLDGVPDGWLRFAGE
jgi:hypothetical protein